MTITFTIAFAAALAVFVVEARRRPRFVVPDARLAHVDWHARSARVA